MHLIIVLIVVIARIRRRVIARALFLFILILLILLLRWRCVQPMRAVGIFLGICDDKLALRGGDLLVEEHRLSLIMRR